VSVLVPAGFIILNHFSFPFLSTNHIRNAKVRMLMAEQIVVQEGVALIFEMPQSGLVAKPKTKRIRAIKIRISSIFLVFSKNLRYKTAQITPTMVIDELDAFPSPNEPMVFFNEDENIEGLSITIELKITKNIKKTMSTSNFSFAKSVMVAQAKYAHPINPNMPHQ
jgi:hypothetical protein